MNIYYALWADAINYQKIKNGCGEYWKAFTFCFMSIFLSFNILTLLIMISFFTGCDITSKIDEGLMLFQSKLLRKFIWATIVLFIPSIGVTYFFVFYKKKYEHILSNYKFRNGRLLLTYYILTVILFFGFALLNRFCSPVSPIFSN